MRHVVSGRERSPARFTGTAAGALRRRGDDRKQLGEIGGGERDLQLRAPVAGRILGEVAARGEVGPGEQQLRIKLGREGGIEARRAEFRAQAGHAKAPEQIGAVGDVERQLAAWRAVSQGRTPQCRSTRRAARWR